MSSWTKNIDIAKDPQTVWNVATDYANLPKWTAKVSKVVVEPPGPAAVGTKVTITRGRITFEQTMREMRAPEYVYSTIVNGPVTGSSKFTFTPSGSGTHVEHTLELQLKGMMKLFSFMIGSGVKKELGMLKKASEGGGQ